MSRCRWQGLICLIPLVVAACGSLPIDSKERAELRRIESLPPDQAAAARRALADAQTDWTPQLREAVENGELVEGMTKRQILFAWGLPTSRMHYPPTSMDAEEWHYGRVSPTVVLDVYDGERGTWARLYYRDSVWRVGDRRPPKGNVGYRLVSERQESPGPAVEPGTP